MMRTLQQDFVNVWVLARDLEAIAAASDDPDIGALCAAIRANYGYPVDSVVIAPDLEVLGHLNVHEPGARDPETYLAFLQQTLGREPAPPAGAERRAVPTSVRVTPDEPAASVLDVVEQSARAKDAVKFFTIDATKFANRCRLEITVRVGSGAAAGTFELCAAAPGEPDAMTPVETLPRVAPGETAVLVHE
ncbi:MAG: hypothetical protein KDE27_15750, partial [Planctomycetes bacterium]|nr:hypothetical protein [Planctomycetota bacterium]